MAISELRSTQTAFNLDQNWVVLEVGTGLQEKCGELLPHFVSRVVEGQSWANKEKWQFNFGTRKDGKPDHGLLIRSRKKNADRDPNEDDKCSWMYRGADLPDRNLLYLLSSRGIDIQPHLMWFRICHEVWVESLALMLKVARAWDNTHNLGVSLADSMLSPSAMAKHVLRINYYDQKGVGGELANGHWDFSGITGCLLESNPGLWLGEENCLWESRTGHIPIFGGRGLEDFSGGKCRALKHGVITAKPGQRCSVVFFAHTATS